MSGKIERSFGFLLAVLSLALFAVPWASADNVPVKAVFVSGSLPGVVIPNKVLNDKDAYYQSGGGNYVFLGGGDGHLCFTVDSKSGRSVVLLFDSVVAPPGTNLGDTCGVPYFLPGPVSTIKWQLLTTNECVLSAAPDAEGYYEMTIKSNNLNLLTMQDGQVAYAYVWRMWFYVADSRTTRRNDTRDNYILDWEPNYIMVTASGWDGTKVTTWTITPVTAKFKHEKADAPGEYYFYDQGTIPRWLISNARRSCFHGIYNLPFELIITRL